MDSSPLRPPYLNRDVFCHEMVEAAAATLEDATSTVLSTLTAPATATARKDDDSSRNVASPASPVSPMSFPSSSSSSSSGSGPGLKKIAEADGYEFFHFCGSGGEGGSGGNGEGERNSAAALPLAEIEALVEEAWAHDYRRSDQARFVYTRAYLEWFTQRDCSDFLLAREKVFDDPAPAAGAGAGAGATCKKQGELVACLANSKRVLYLASERRVAPVVYSTLLTVSPRHRKRRLALTLFAVLPDFLGSYYNFGVAFCMGAFDGRGKTESFERGVHSERERVHAAAAAAGAAAGSGAGAAERAAAAAAAAATTATVATKTRLLPFWACTRDLAELLRYMPLSSQLLTSVALSWPVRRLLEVSFRQRRRREPADADGADAADAKADYRVSLVEPRGVSYPVPGAPETSGFVLNETLATLYGTGRPNVAGTMRVDFLDSGHFAEVYFVRHVLSKNGLSERRSCVQIQIVDRGDTTRAELRRALEIVCDEFFEWKGSKNSPGGNGNGGGNVGGGGGGGNGNGCGGGGDDDDDDDDPPPCIGVLMQNWIDIPALDLLRIRFLPSGRTLGFQVGRYAREGAPEIGENLLFDLV
jgi:hypothetical protein